MSLGQAPLNRLGDQIVIGVASDAHVGKLAKRQVTAHQHPAVNVWCIGLATGDEVRAKIDHAVTFLRADVAVLP